MLVPEDTEIGLAVCMYVIYIPCSSLIPGLLSNQGFHLISTSATVPLEEIALIFGDEDEPDMMDGCRAGVAGGGDEEGIVC